MLSRLSKLSTLPYLWFLFVGIMVSLTGCVTTSLNSDNAEPQTIHAFGPLTHDSRWYLNQIDQAPNDKRFDLQVLATRSLINEGDEPQSIAVQQQLSKEVYTIKQRAALRILNALRLNHQGHTENAIAQIANLDVRPLDQTTVAFYYRLQAELLAKTNQVTAAAHSLIALAPYLKGEEANKNNQQIWEYLQKSSLNLLRNYRNAAARDHSELGQGWYELAMIHQKGNSQADLLAWQQKFPNHPGAQFAGQKTTPATNNQPLNQPQFAGEISQTNSIQNVAVFLPLSGSLANAGNALKTGIDVANNEGPHYTLHYYDENSMLMSQLLQQAQKDGAQAIIGPLQKNKLQDLVSQNPNIPVLGLNQIDNTTTSGNLYYFALSPEAEAAAIAAKMHDTGVQHPLLILPSNAFGERSAAGFNQYWNGLSQGPADIAKFRTKQELMNILMQKVAGGAQNTVSSNLQAGQVQSLGSGSAAPATSGQQADGIYMVATAFEAATIRRSVDEMLGKSSFRPNYFLGSKTNSPGMKPDVALGLNRMWMGDMPLMLDRVPDQYAKAAAALPNATGDQFRLYAMGYDSLKLIPQLSALRQNPEQSLTGLTGNLHITTDGVIIRDLAWIRFSDGRMVNP